MRSLISPFVPSLHVSSYPGIPLVYLVHSRLLSTLISPSYSTIQSIFSACPVVFAVELSRSAIHLPTWQCELYKSPQHLRLQQNRLRQSHGLYVRSVASPQSTLSTDGTRLKHLLDGLPIRVVKPVHMLRELNDSSLLLMDLLVDTWWWIYDCIAFSINGRLRTWFLLR